MIYAENAVVQPKDNCHCDWVPQCPRCGHIELSWVRNQYVGSGGFLVTSNMGRKTCSKCKTQYEVKLFNRN
jgi:transcription elongation factor Elf1